MAVAAQEVREGVHKCRRLSFASAEGPFLLQGAQAGGLAQVVLGVARPTVGICRCWGVYRTEVGCGGVLSAWCASCLRLRLARLENSTEPKASLK